LVCLSPPHPAPWGLVLPATSTTLAPIGAALQLCYNILMPQTVNSVHLSTVTESLPTAPPDRLFRTQGQVITVERVRGDCHFTLDSENTQLPCVLPRRDAARIGFWVKTGQTVEVKGYAGRADGQWRLNATTARLIHGESSTRLSGHSSRSARRVVNGFGTLLDTLFGTADE
jgi:hypothetical protein